jgi:SAM-dependent methyltransferase
MTTRTFADFEREGWDRIAPSYADVVLRATEQAFVPVLDSLGDLRGKRVLELASGTGHLAQAAVARGADVVGVDVAENMVSLARKTASGAEFRVADAEDLPFEDASFDAVICCFGLLHMANPDKAVSEAGRVLKPDGRFSFTVWQAPENGNEFVSIVLEAYGAHADTDVDLPPSPPMFLMADAAARNPLLTSAGFSQFTENVLEIVWPISSPDTMVEFIDNGAVRIRLLYERQTPDVKEKIRAAVVGATNGYLSKGHNAIPMPALLVTATQS